MSTTPQDMIHKLTGEIARLQESNLALQDGARRLDAPARSPDDIASALQRTVNDIQTKLSSLSNPISNFAVKEFRLETNLGISITPLGTLEFHLLQPGANIDPNAVSKLSLSLVPIEKMVPQATFVPLAFEPQKELSAIGVSDTLRATLEQNHIFTISDFRSTAMRAKVRAALIATEATTAGELALLQARAELALLAGVDGAVADRLLAANIDSLQAVARSSAEGLMLVVEDLELGEAERWVSAAQSFTGVNETTTRVVRIDTSPANLYVRAGSEPFSDVPFVRQWPVRRHLALQTLRAQLIGRTGYAFKQWSNLAATPAITLETPATVSARFYLACHHVLAVSASEGGVLLIEPRAGGVRGFPASCYEPGKKIELVAQPEPGFALDALTITAGGTTRTVTTLRTPVVVEGPITAKATFRPLQIFVREAV